MCCFVAPMAEAIVTTVTTIVLEHTDKSAKQAGELQVATKKQAVCKNLKVLSKMLWGGSVLLAFEHVWHGELQAFYPFLTAASSPEAMSQMWHEVATVGTSMAGLVTVAWAALTAFRSKFHKAVPAEVKAGK
ncbi:MULTISPECIES: hypothetical protein [unclassified Fibrobacter]|uniref:hypothetical protein n=1 Tax=unclassified Fibrobacter TaxID=2634177 RepID=UPI00090ECDF6|nr:MULTISPECIES: hypothetical protein [unclassified Fibrobacter]OWV04911.1 hypothetical protein B7993_09555 [Fibrobacter sp. UWH3]SHK38419.1 hypothetical protein SAMN05720765_102104 [Fibrobacter sp. UWH6]